MLGLGVDMVWARARVKIRGVLCRAGLSLRVG